MPTRSEFFSFCFQFIPDGYSIPGEGYPYFIFQDIAEKNIDICMFHEYLYCHDQVLSTIFNAKEKADNFFFHLLKERQVYTIDVVQNIENATWFYNSKSVQQSLLTVQSITNRGSKCIQR